MDFHGKVERRTAPAEARQVTFKGLAEVWFSTARATLKASSAIGRELAMRQLSRFLGKMPVRQIARRDCETWVAPHAGQVSARVGSSASRSGWVNWRFTWRSIEMLIIRVVHFAPPSFLLKNIQLPAGTEITPAMSNVGACLFATKVRPPQKQRRLPYSRDRCT